MIVIAVLLAGCGLYAGNDKLPWCPELGATDPLPCDDATGICTYDGAQCVTSLRLDVTWSLDGESTSLGAIECTDVISHPCPFLLYTHTLKCDGVRCSWMDATGGTDQAGVRAEDRLPWDDTATVGADGSITFGQRGDDGGLRHEFVLARTDTGYAGDATWNLFTVAGATTFHIEAR